MKYVIPVVVAFIFVLYPTIIAAQEEERTFDENPQDVMDIRERQDDRIEVVNNRCERVSERVGNLTARYENNRLLYINRYTAISQRLKNLVSILDDNGIEASELEAMIRELEENTDELSSVTQQVIMQLNRGANLACGDNTDGEAGVFRDAIQNARQVREIIQEINSFLRSEIIPELREIN